MEVARITGHAPRTAAVGEAVARGLPQCIGCPGCRGLCTALIEVLTLPEAVAREYRQA